MKKSTKVEIIAVAELLRDAFGVFGKDVNKQFDKVETDISGLTVLMVENFTETQERIEKLRSATEGFVKLHDVLDGQFKELERKVNKLELLVQKLAH